LQIQRREIYKDTYKSSSGYSDYQFRPNFCIAMAVAPEMFNPTHARIALKKAETILLVFYLSGNLMCLGKKLYGNENFRSQ
jgi:glycogen debranching enzyme